MLSKMSFFNLGVFKKTVCRFWPVYIGYFAIWALMMPLGFVNDSYYTEVQFQIVQFIPQGSAIMAFIFGSISALAVFSYLYNLRSCVMMHSLPVKREALFTTNYIAGLSFMIVPNILIYALTAVVLEVNGLFGAQAFIALNTWFVCTCIMCLFFYSFAVFLCMICGTWFMMPIVYGILNFTAILIETIAHSALEMLVYGYRAGATVMQIFSPLIYMMSEFSFYTWRDGVRVLGASSGIYGYLAVLGAVAVAFAVISLIMYKKRHMENAGEIIAVSVLRPVFKYCFAAGCAVVIGAFIYGIIGFESGLAMYICAVIGGAIGYFVAVMALKKSFRLKISAVKGFAVFAVAVTLLFAAVSFDLFGVEKYVPNAASVKLATINIEGEYMDVTDGEISLSQLLQIHRKLAAQKDESINTIDKIYSVSSGIEGRVVSVSIEYHTNWRTIRRYYRVPITEELLNDHGSAQSLIADAVNDMNYITKKFEWVYSNDLPYQINIDLYYEESIKKTAEGTATEGVGLDIVYTPMNGYISIAEPDERIAKLINAFKNDIQSGIYQVFGAENSRSIGSMSIYYMVEDPNNYYYDYFGEKHIETRKSSYYISIYPGGELEKLAAEYILKYNSNK